MPTVFKNTVNQNIGTTSTTVLTVPVGTKATVIGFNLTNTTEFDAVKIDVQVTNDGAVTEVFYVKDMIIPPRTTAKIVTQGEKLIVPSQGTIKVTSDTASSVDLTLSYVEIS
jgi:hypothetical protein